MTFAESVRRGKAIVFFGLFYWLALSTYWFKPWGTANGLAQTVVYLTAPILAVGASLYLLLQHGLTEKRSLLFFSLFAGLAFLLVGEGIYIYFDYFLGERPFPTVADAFYLLSYPFIFLSIAIAASLLRDSIRGANFRFRTVFWLLFLILAGLGGYFGVYLAYSPDETLLVNLINLAYGIGDLLIIAGAAALFYLARNARKTAENYLWTGVVVGFGSISAADMLFANFTDLYLSGNAIAVNVMDSLWMFGYTTIAFFIMNFVVRVLPKDRAD